ncbi:DUF4367 domain-containing protein [Anaerovorax odorimutans]|uniref:DUF4367 domain-containing protein n=1 Tax=Anaerovorax odorimutans TaxID=109327 RepID=A0ABT1RQA2_9FIRM|nr:DUF4367 domain-containing protein [Anaerovorax odorimutans]MCQ4637344.1 DUF4367 domain-containing protein [Anaerovorax odorimutans]
MKKEKPTYTHEERVEFVQKAAEEDYKEEIGELPPLNRDFMKSDQDMRKKPNRAKRYAAIAAAVVLVFLVGSMISAITSNDEAYGDKGLLHRLYKSIQGLGTDKQDELTENVVLDELQISSMDDIDAAINFADGVLYVPEYIPSGYKLVSLSMESYSLGDFIAKYKFTNDKDAESLGITEMYSPVGGQVSCSGDGELIKLKDRAIYLQEGDEKGILYATVYTEDSMTQIDGKLSREEILKVAKNLKKTP